MRRRAVEESKKRETPELSPLDLAALLTLLGQALLREEEKR